MVLMKCPVCNISGSLMLKTTKTKTSTGKYKTYKKFYVYHGKKAKKPWCYLNKKHLSRADVKEALDRWLQDKTFSTKDYLMLRNLFERARA